MNREAERKEYGVYVNSMLSKKVTLSIVEIGKNVKYNLEKKIKQSIEGRCIGEGFVRPKTVEIISYSSGLIKDDHVEFQVIYRCLICNPVKDMEMDCVVNNVTKAGIHAFVKDDDDNTPVTVFVARDHHTTDQYFESVQDKDHIRVRIIGIRYELNDPSITAIAALIKERVQRVVREQEYEPREQEYEPREQEYEPREQEYLHATAAEMEKNAVFGPIVTEYLMMKQQKAAQEPALPEPVAVVYDEEILKNAKKRHIVIKK
jgi:DNA-directed RNA polymerase subunit E'/Rpb7